MTKYRINSCILLVVTFMAAFTSLSAQERINLDEKPQMSFKDHLFYGGGLGLQFGTVTLVDISPMIGYKVTQRIGIGVSPTYKFYSYTNYYGQSENLKTNVFGGSIFTRIVILENVFAHAEYELLAYKTKDPSAGGVIQTLNYQSVLVGGGYRERIGENAFMNLMVLWNLNETPDSPYTNPIIRAGFSIGF